MKKLIHFSQEEIGLLKTVHGFSQAKKVKLYLVGGILRDKLLEREKENPDFDFAIKKGAIAFARALAKKMRAGFVVLDKEHDACRIVKKIPGKVYTFDFSGFRGPTLEKDLLNRDFTINSLALELGKAFQQSEIESSLIDPLGAGKDLRLKVIRLTHKKAFSQDPLRILRAFSLACIFGFRIDKTTLGLAKKEKDKLLKVSFERIRDELFKIFDSPRAWRCLAELDALKIIDVLFPEIKPMRGIGQGPYHHLDVWQHTLETIKQLEGVFVEFSSNQDIQAYLKAVVAAERKRLAMLKLGAFLHDIGKPKALRKIKGKTTFHGHEGIGSRITDEISKRLRLSNDELNALRRIVFCHLRPGYLADNEAVSARAKFRFFRDTADETAGVLLISLADQRATKGPLTTRKSRLKHERVVGALLEEYFKKQKEIKPARLVSGDDIMREFKLKPSPLIGVILREIEELQAIGKIKSSKEALSRAATIIKKNPPA